MPGSVVSFFPPSAECHVGSPSFGSPVISHCCLEWGHRKKKGIRTFRLEAWFEAQLFRDYRRMIWDDSLSGGPFPLLAGGLDANGKSSELGENQGSSLGRTSLALKCSLLSVLGVQVFFLFCFSPRETPCKDLGN